MAFVVGVWSLAAQFIFNRIIFFYLAHSDVAAACIITVHLTGFLIGTLVAPRLKLPLTTLLCAAITLSVLAATTVWLAGAPVLGLGATVALTILFGVLLATLSGMLLIRLIQSAKTDNAARPIIIADSAGSVFGAALAGFYLVPYAGITLSFLCLFAAQALALILAARQSQRLGHMATGLAIAALGSAILLFWPSSTHLANATVQPEWASRIVAKTITPDPTENPRHLTFSQNSPYGVVSVFEGENGTLMMLDNKPLCQLGNTPLAQHFQYQLGNLPAKMVSQTANAATAQTAIVGLGCGLTLAGMLNELGPNTHTQVIEINPHIPAAQKLFANKLPHNPTDPRVQLTIADGFKHFAQRHSAQPYQAVVLDLSWSFDMVATHLFTVEMFRNIKANLTEDGVLALWLSSSNPFSPEGLIGYRTLKAVFPHVYAESADGMILYVASTRKDIARHISPEGQRISGWLSELPTEGPINTLDTLILARQRIGAGLKELTRN